MFMCFLQSCSFNVFVFFSTLAPLSVYVCHMHSCSDCGLCIWLIAHGTKGCQCELSVSFRMFSLLHTEQLPWLQFMMIVFNFLWEISTEFLGRLGNIACCQCLQVFTSLRVINSKFKFIRPTLVSLKCEHNRQTVSYIFQHFLSAIIRESLYQLKVISFELSCNVRHGHSLTHTHTLTHSLTHSLTSSTSSGSITSLFESFGLLNCFFPFNVMHFNNTKMRQFAIDFDIASLLVCIIMSLCTQPKLVYMRTLNRGSQVAQGPNFMPKWENDKKLRNHTFRKLCEVLPGSTRNESKMWENPKSRKP